MQELPKWRCHKVVQAAKVDGIGTKMDWLWVGGQEIAISDDLRKRLPPDPIDWITGYYVRYEDGYESWSPAKAFEEGYTRIDVDPYLQTR